MPPTYLYISELVPDKDNLRQKMYRGEWPFLHLVFALRARSSRTTSPLKILHGNPKGHLSLFFFEMWP